MSTRGPRTGSTALRPITTGCKHANDRPSRAFEAPGAVVRMFTTLRRATRESARGHGSSASALRAVPAGSASSPRPRARGTGIVEDPAERAIAEARQPSQDRVFPPPHQLSRRPSFTHLRTHTYARSLSNNNTGTPNLHPLTLKDERHQRPPQTVPVCISNNMYDRQTAPKERL